MVALPPNFILLVCAATVGSIVGFIIYGLIVGFENTFKGSEGKPEGQSG
jgi:hypothetical protein